MTTCHSHRGFWTKKDLEREVLIASGEVPPAENIAEDSEAVEQD